jgi:D-psicose/D-tagatose/L-ribulose 3-epimerase
MTNGALGYFGVLASVGYEHIEICVDDGSALDAELVRAEAERNGLALSIGGVFTADRDLSADTEAGRQQGLEYLLRCIAFASAVGATIVSGPMYSAAGKTRVLSGDDRAVQRDWAVANLQSAAEYAADRGVTLSLEPLNRFETDLVNTVEQALELVTMIDRANVGLTLDTFHLHIEEKSLGDAIRLADSQLVSFQASENDRGTPGTGQVHWDEAFDALHGIGYAGPVVVESFDWSHPDIAAGLSLWRPVAASMEDLARQSIEFLRPYCRDA